jgi:divalent metal cation (Fe/Co/Zn/Cd) transporter
VLHQSGFPQAQHGHFLETLLNPVTAITTFPVSHEVSAAYFPFRDQRTVVREKMRVTQEIDKLKAERHGRLLSYLTIGWNSLEGIIAIGAGVIVGSIALVGFGFDSVIEVLSGVIILWRLMSGERRERLALRIVGVSFIALAAYVAFDAVKSLVYREDPETSYIGIAIAALSLVVMPFLAHAKREVAAKLNSRSMRADSRQTDLCAYLSAILLGGLILNATLGWWWADPVAAMIMVPIIAKEGIEAFQGEICDDGCR